MLDPHSLHKTPLFSKFLSQLLDKAGTLLCALHRCLVKGFFHSLIHSRHFRLIMFASHRPRVFRSRLGCCICGAKSSSSRFTSSSKYELLFSGCFQLNEKRQGEICNACVLLVKRWKKLPSGSSKNWKHVRKIVESFCGCVFIQDLRCARAVSLSSMCQSLARFFFLTGCRQQSNCKKNY